MIVVNKSNDSITTNLQVEGGSVEGDLKAYMTDANQNWKEEIIARGESNTYPITIPAMSIVTYVGSVQ